jgi:hypothetical protein
MVDQRADDLPGILGLVGDQVDNIRRKSGIADKFPKP